MFNESILSHSNTNSTEHFCSGVITTLCSAYVTQIMCNFEMGILLFCCTKMVFLRMTYRGPLCGMCGGVGVGVWCGVECGVVWCVVWCGVWG